MSDFSFCPTVFSTHLKNIYFLHMWNCRLQTLSVWKSLKSVLWERVKWAMLWQNSFPYSLFWDCLKFKEAADDNWNLDIKGFKDRDYIENILEKGKIAHFEPFHLFPQCFPKAVFFNVLKWVYNGGKRFIASTKSINPCQEMQSIQAGMGSELFAAYEIFTWQKTLSLHLMIRSAFRQHGFHWSVVKWQLAWYWL